MGELAQGHVRPSGLSRVFDLGLDPASTSPEELRRTRILSIASVTIGGVGLLSIPRYAELGMRVVVVAFLVALALALVNLEVLRRTRRVNACAHAALAILSGAVLVANLSSGGFSDAHFGWFYLLPLAAAVVVDLRGAAAWLGLVVALTIVMWMAPHLGYQIRTQVPPGEQTTQDLFNRLTVLMGLGMIGWSFVQGQRRAERDLARSNDDLRHETAYVQLLRHAAMAANEAASFEEALQDGVGRICRAMGWEMGGAMRVDARGRLIPLGIHHVELPTDGITIGRAMRGMMLAPGEGIGGRALLEGRPVSNAVRDSPDQPLGAVGHSLGLRTGFAVPVRVRGEISVVLQFATRKQIGEDPRLLEVLGDIAVQFGRVAERCALEEQVRQAQKLDALGQLAAGIAHEINNPMSYVRANLNLVQGEWKELRGSLDAEPRVQEHMAELEQAIVESSEGVDRVIAIVRDMRQFAHGGDHERRRLALNEVAEAAIRVASPHAAAGVQLLLDVGEAPPVRGAHGMLVQVIVNGVVNALQAVGEEGTVRISILGERRGAVVRVDDDGPGVPEEARQRLFDPFFSTKPAGEGTGLGLYVSYQIARSHGGELTVSELPRGGTRFELWLPPDGDTGPDL